jgi:hypothetical protein
MYNIAIVASMKAFFSGGVEGCLSASVYKLSASAYYLRR